jgi:hypothetical protein
MIDIALAIAIALSLIRGADFFLLPAQQQAIQAFFEDLTRYVQTAADDGLRERFHEEGVRFLLVLCIWAAWTTLSLVVFLPYAVFPRFRELAGAGFPGLVEGMGPYLIGCALALALILALRRLVDRPMRWVLVAATPAAVRRRAWLVASGAFVLALAVTGLGVVLFAPRVFDIGQDPAAARHWLETLVWFAIPFNSLIISPWPWAWRVQSPQISKPGSGPGC